MWGSVGLPMIEMKSYLISNKWKNNLANMKKQLKMKGIREKELVIFWHRQNSILSNKTNSSEKPNKETVSGMTSSKGPWQAKKRWGKGLRHKSYKPYNCSRSPKSLHIMKGIYDNKLSEQPTNLMPAWRRPGKIWGTLRPTINSWKKPMRLWEMNEEQGSNTWRVLYNETKILSIIST